MVSVGGNMYGDKFRRMGMLIMIAILLIVFAPPIIAARRRPSVKI